MSSVGEGHILAAGRNLAGVVGRILAVGRNLVGVEERNRVGAGIQPYSLQVCNL